MDNTPTNSTDVLQPNTRPSDKEIMDALIKQAKFAEDYYVKLLSQFQENLRKKYLNL
jgi:hypothetical protein